MKYGNIIFLFLSFPLLIFGQTQELRFFEYNEALESYVPAVKPDKSVSFFVLCEIESNEVLQVCLPDGGSILLDNKLVGSSDNAICKYYKLDSLANLIFRDSVFVTVYSENLVTMDIQITDPTIGPESELISKFRDKSVKDEFFIISLLTMLFIIGVWRFGLHYQSLGYLSITTLFAIRVRDSSMYNTTFFQLDNLKFFGILCLMMALFAMQLNEKMSTILLYYNDNTLFSLLFCWILNSLFFLIILYFKFLLVSFFAEAYNFRSYKHIQYYDFTRFVFLGTIILFTLVTINFAGWGFLLSENLDWVLVLALTILLSFVVLTYQKLNKFFSNKKLHLFFYLCATEIIPIILIIKISR